MNCQHRRVLPNTYMVVCELINKEVSGPETVGMSSCCARCESQWLDGNPPTLDGLPPVLQMVLELDETIQVGKSRGLGDTIAKFTAATGINKVVEAIAGGDCGCKQRQEALNKLVPYKG